jgi:hypothetical protein
MNEGIVGMEKTIRPLERSVQEIKLEFERLSVAASNDKMLKVLLMVTNKMKEASQQIGVEDQGRGFGGGSIEEGDAKGSC